MQRIHCAKGQPCRGGKSSFAAAKRDAFCTAVSSRSRRFHHDQSQHGDGAALDVRPMAVQLKLISKPPLRTVCTVLLHTPSYVKRASLQSSAQGSACNDVEFTGKSSGRRCLIWHREQQQICCTSGGAVDISDCGSMYRHSSPPNPAVSGLCWLGGEALATRVSSMSEMHSVKVALMVISFRDVQYIEWFAYGSSTRASGVRCACWHGSRYALALSMPDIFVTYCASSRRRSCLACYSQ